MDRKSDQEFEAVLQAMAGQQYHHYGPLGTTVGVPGLEGAGQTSNPWAVLAQREQLAQEQLKQAAHHREQLSEALTYLRAMSSAMQPPYQPTPGEQDLRMVEAQGSVNQEQRVQAVGGLHQQLVENIRRVGTAVEGAVASAA